MARNLTPMSYAMESAIASKSVQTILDLLDQGEPINSRQGSTGVPLLTCVIRQKLIDLAQHLIERGADIEAKSAEGETPLMEAVIVGSIELVQSLLEHGANPNRKSRSGWTALLWAQVHGHQDILNVLIAPDENLT